MSYDTEPSGRQDEGIRFLSALAAATAGTLNAQVKRPSRTRAAPTTPTDASNAAFFVAGSEEIRAAK